MRCEQHSSCGRKKSDTLEAPLTDAREECCRIWRVDHTTSRDAAPLTRSVVDKRQHNISMTKFVLRLVFSCILSVSFCREGIQTLHLHFPSLARHQTSLNTSCLPWTTVQIANFTCLGCRFHHCCFYDLYARFKHRRVQSLGRRLWDFSMLTATEKIGVGLDKYQ